jgi:hypothetical protein
MWRKEHGSKTLETSDGADLRERLSRIRARVHVGIFDT